MVVYIYTFRIQRTWAWRIRSVKPPGEGGEEEGVEEEGEEELGRTLSYLYANV